MKLTPEVIRVCRVNLGMSQGQLARRSDVSAALIGAIERGDRKLLPEVERRIRAAIPLTDDEIEELVEVNRKVTKKAAGNKREIFWRYPTAF